MTVGRCIDGPNGIGNLPHTREDDLILLEVTFTSGRPKEKRLQLLKALNNGVVSAAGISPDDQLSIRFFALTLLLYA